jgi:glycosyltransferase involved in cell wall biosynthesis
MEILYVSNYCSPKVINYLFENSKSEPGQAVQKFHRLLVDGLNKQNRVSSIKLISSIPVTISINRKFFWNFSKEKIDKIEFNFLPFLNVPIIKHFCLFFFTFIKVAFLGNSRKKEDKIVLCDVLNTSIAIAAFIACKISSKKIVAIYTDLPSNMVTDNFKNKFIGKVYLRTLDVFFNRFDYFIELTEHMNSIVNPIGKPYLVMEGLVDGDIEISTDTKDKPNKKIIIYAGAILSKYGIEDLINGFSLVKMDDIELHLYGPGEFVSKLDKYIKDDPRIRYFGVVKNNFLLDKLSEATLLINPRPTTEDFVKYSFPSKNLEFMSTGVPLITTKLPGMPIDYYPYVYLLEDESKNGIANLLKQLLLKSKSELTQFGHNAQKFVIDNKSNHVQVRKILDFIEAP